ncbi:hypothetical protein [Streptomyces amakusaensis]|uniref:Uncharacterized protein n=1 Tax=Streptomyces amakusaensis TaxID=67271 RepID=A0ABW0AGL3_9ACTN
MIAERENATESAFFSTSAAEAAGAIPDVIITAGAITRADIFAAEKLFICFPP